MSVKESKRGEAGSKALGKYRDKIEMNTKKAIRRVCKKYLDNKTPIAMKDIADEVGISISTIYRDPYVKIVKSYMDNEEAVLSPNGKQDVSEIVKENIRLKDEIKEWKEKYFRLKKELANIKDLF